MRFRLVVPLAALALAGCVSFPGVPKEADQNLIDAAWPYALLSYNAYHDGPPAFRLPWRFARVDAVPNDDIGLAYDVYRERRSDGDYLVFAFRGTEKPDDASVWTNCDWLYGNFRTDQQRRAEAVVRKYDSGVPPDHLIFAGHSLGGGIATHLSYIFPGSSIYVFDTSPRADKPSGYVLTNTDRLPYRRTAVAQRFEALRFVRLFGNEPREYSLPVECMHGSPLDRHAMRPLAICLTRLAAAGTYNAIGLEAMDTIRNNPELFSRMPPPITSSKPPTCEKKRSH